MASCSTMASLTIALASLQTALSLSLLSSSSTSLPSLSLTSTRRAIAFGSCVSLASLLSLSNFNPTPPALAQLLSDELRREEDRIVHLFQVFLVDARGNSFIREGKIVGFDPAFDLAVLKVDAGGYEIKPAALGTSKDIHVGQSSFAIGNPYGYENTQTTWVISGLGREIPAPNGGAIQTDAAINAASLTLD